MSSCRLLWVIGFVLLVGDGLVAAAQMPAMPQMPQPPQMSPAPPMNPAAPTNPNQIPQDPQQMPSMGSAGQADGGGQGAGFLGAWCAQGDPTKQASISNNGAFLNLTNESGDTSIGNLQGPNQISAPGWQFVTGNLSGDGSRINWSNGTFWARCYNGGGGGGNRRPNLNGNWYPNGNRSLSCSIQQRRGNLTLQNESGQRATGSFNGRNHLSTNWQGTTINGTLSRDGNTINWDNGTYWIRYRLY
jgi:hypothetical protein